VHLPWISPFITVSAEETGACRRLRRLVSGTPRLRGAPAPEHPSGTASIALFRVPRQGVVRTCLEQAFTTKSADYTQRLRVPGILDEQVFACA